MLYYGYVILGASMVLDVCTSPGHSSGFNIFINDMMEATESTRAATSATYSAALFASSLLTPIVGHIVDHYGVRPAACFAAVGSAAGLVGLSYTHSLPSFAVFLCLLRFAGPECVAVCVNTCLYRWWVTKRGGISMLRSLDGFIVMSFPALVVGVVEQFGWRSTMRYLAVAVLAGGAAAAWLLVDTPEAMNLAPDGDGDSKSKGKGKGKAGGTDGGSDGGGSGGCDCGGGGHGGNADGSRDCDGSKAAAAAIVAHAETAPGPEPKPEPELEPELELEPEWEYADAVREPFLYKIIFTDATSILFFTGVNVHALDLFESRGLTKTEVAGLSVYMSAGVLLGQLLVGSRLDGMKPQHRTRLLSAMYCIVLLTQLWFIRPSSAATATMSTQTAISLWYFIFGVAFGGIIIYR